MLCAVSSEWRWKLFDHIRYPRPSNVWFFRSKDRGHNREYLLAVGRAANPVVLMKTTRPSLLYSEQAAATLVLLLGVTRQ